jgi:hypothetical protein
LKDTATHFARCPVPPPSFEQLSEVLRELARSSTAEGAQDPWKLGQGVNLEIRFWISRR